MLTDPSPPKPVATRQLLHVGCGKAGKDRLPVYFQNPQWQEIRLDIDPAVSPDIVGNVTDLRMLANASVDAIWSSHNLEHLNSFEVPLALSEFRRVVKPDGFVLISLPDLRAIARLIADDQLTEPMYESAAGPISPLDVLFGHQASLAYGNHYMAHRTGFTGRTLGQAVLAAGFAEVRVYEGQRWDLWAIGTMPETRPEVFDELSAVMQ